VVKTVSATGAVPQNVNFAIKASVALAFLLRYSNPFDGDPGDWVPHAPLSEEQIKQRNERIKQENSKPLLSTPEIAKLAQGIATQVICLR
jgi:hypothetical protein